MKQLRHFIKSDTRSHGMTDEYVVSGMMDNGDGTEITCIGRDEERTCKRQLRSAGYKDIISWKKD